MSLPPRTADTMSMAIAMSSPSGRMSKRSRVAAEKALSLALFGPGGATRESITGVRVQTVEEKVKYMLQRAAFLRGLAARGMGVRKYVKEAERVEREAGELLKAMETGEGTVKP